MDHGSVNSRQEIGVTWTIIEVNVNIKLRGNSDILRWKYVTVP